MPRVDGTLVFAEPCELQNEIALHMDGPKKPYRVEQPFGEDELFVYSLNECTRSFASAVPALLVEEWGLRPTMDVAKDGEHFLAATSSP